ncbi:MAG: diguanylate cyclase [Terracidiphilus sp.]
MLAADHLSVLIASDDPTLVDDLELVLTAAGARVEVAPLAEASLAAWASPHPPRLAFLDVEMPGLRIGQVLAAARANQAAGHAFIALLADNVSEQWAAWVQDGVLDDLIPRSFDHPSGRLRLEVALRASRISTIPPAIGANDCQSRQLDPLTRVYNRSSLLSLLFCETDRAQRMKTPLSLLLFAIDDCTHWNTRLDPDAINGLLCAIAERTGRFLRSYDLLGRSGKDEFLVILPGCTTNDAIMLAERLRIDIFGAPFSIASESIGLSACFGIAASDGRSPLVVLHEAEVALRRARSDGPDSVECFARQTENDLDPAAFLSVEFEKRPR